MREHYYLDNAATTWPKPELVYQFMDSFFRSHGVNPGRAGHELAVEAEHMIVSTRRMIGQFFGFAGDPARVAFTQNATDSLNMALFGLLKTGDHMITTRMEHNSVLRPANHLERDHGVAVTRLARSADGYIDPEDVRAAIQPNTKVVVINHASNVLGSVQDIAAIGRIVADSGAIFMIDSAQTAGVLDIDMEAMHIDVLTFTGHKGLFGPMGIGGIIVRDGVDIKAPRVGGTGVDSITPFQPDIYPFRLEAGTVNIPGIAGLNAAQKWFAELGREHRSGDSSAASHAELCRIARGHIHAVELAHVRRLDQGLRAIDGVTVYGPGDNQARVATVAMNIDKYPADQVGEMMDADYHLCVRAGLHCAPLVHEDQGTIGQNGAVRIAPGYFSDNEDIEQVITAVTELAAD
jgi:cysteine desulfurase / selenocysteine lyase